MTELNKIFINYVVNYWLLSLYYTELFFRL